MALASQYTAHGGTEAIRIASEGLSADPGDVTLWVLLGYLHRINGDESGATQAWAQGLNRIHTETTSASNLRTMAWLANLHAGVGDALVALRRVEELVEADPHNGYLWYRLAHVLAETGRLDDAVGMLDSAVTHGFLSTQLLRREAILALAPLRGVEGFAEVLRRLDAKVKHCQKAYAAALPRAAVASQSVEGGDVW